jgi:NAD+ synthase
LGIRWIKIDITPMLEIFHVYEDRETIVRRYFPEFGPSWKYRLVMPQNLLEKDRFNVASLEVQNNAEKVFSSRLSMEDYLGMVAATNIKQRTRMILLYFHAEKHNLLVCGTTNLPETKQGFFVKHGDGGVDIEPIANLYKTQVYQLARHVDVPREIIDRTPTPDTFSFFVSDKEYYFCLTYEMLDLLLYAQTHPACREKIKTGLGIDDGQMDRVFQDFQYKERATAHIREMPPMAPIPEIATGVC